MKNIKLFSIKMSTIRGFMLLFALYCITQLSAMEGFYKNVGMNAGFGADKATDVYGKFGLGALWGRGLNLGLEGSGQLGTFLAKDTKTMYVSALVGPKAGLQLPGIGFFVSRLWGYSPTFVLLDEQYQSKSQTYFSTSWDFNIAFVSRDIAFEIHYMIDQRMPDQSKTSGVGLAFSFF